MTRRSLASSTSKKWKTRLAHTLCLRYRPVERDWHPEPTNGSAVKLEPNQQLRQPGPLFKKLEESVIEEERARLGK